MLKHTAIILLLPLIATGARALTRHETATIASPAPGLAGRLLPHTPLPANIPSRDALYHEASCAKSPRDVPEPPPRVHRPFCVDGIPASIERRKKSTHIRAMNAGPHHGRSERPGASGTYRVRPGDTLFGVARRFGVTVDALCAANGMSRDTSLSAGRRIRLPAGPGRGAAKARRAGCSASASPAREDIAGAPRFIWPVRNVCGIKRDGESGVRPIGIIIGGRAGAPVISSARGVVEKIGTMRGFGHYVIIKHESHFLTVYSRMNGISVSEGDTVGRGRVIGSQGGELHFQINRSGRPLNPLELLPDRS